MKNRVIARLRVEADGGEILSGTAIFFKNGDQQLLIPQRKSRLRKYNAILFKNDGQLPSWHEFANWENWQTPPGFATPIDPVHIQDL